jgi:hypothetical protein
MFERASVRMLPLTNRAAEYTPMATACCNACRTCATTNLVALASAGTAAAVASAGRFAKRLARRH